MVLLLSDADVGHAISMGDAVGVVEQALRQYASGTDVVLPRISVDVPGNGGAFRVMSAILPNAGFFGLKSLTGYPGRRLAGETYFVILLFSCETGALRAIMAANKLTGIRTGAATGVAAKHLARANSRVVGIFGAGVQGWYQVAALKEVRPVEEVRIFDVDRAKADVFAGRVSAQFGVRASVVSEAREAVEGCDMVVTMTSAKTPVFDGAWLQEGTHLSGAGSNSPAKRELDAVTFRRSKIVVDFRDQVLDEAGDLREAIRSGVIGPEAIHAELAEVIVGTKAGRTDDREITLFKSVGMALEDIATAGFVYQRALASGLGTKIALEEPALVSMGTGAAAL